jgi:hypothetical protein
VVTVVTDATDNFNNCPPHHVGDQLTNNARHTASVTNCRPLTLERERFRPQAQRRPKGPLLRPWVATGVATNPGPFGGRLAKGSSRCWLRLIRKFKPTFIA